MTRLKWKLVSVRLEIVLVLMQDSVLCRTYHRLGNRFGRTRWNSELAKLKWKPVLVGLAIVLILTLDGCMVCAERTLGSEIVLDASDGTPR